MLTYEEEIPWEQSTARLKVHLGQDGPGEPNQERAWIIMVSATSELLGSLVNAHDQFINAKDGGWEGCRQACEAVARYLYDRDLNPELAVPFSIIKESFRDLQDGVTPELFDKTKTPRERSRSRFKKYLRAMAAACMDALMNGGMNQDNAAAHVARHAQKWPGLENQELTAITIRYWRQDMLSKLPDERRQFDLMRREMASKPDDLDRILREGPPSAPKS